MPFTDQDPIAPLENLLNQAVSEAVSTSGTNLDTLRPIKTFKWDNDSERNAQVGMTAGDQGYQIDTKVVYTYSGSAWVITGGVRNLQLDTTNSTAWLTTQYGIGKITGNNTTSISEAVTFPAAFASIPFMQITHLGYRGVGAFNTTGLLWTAGINPNAMVGTPTPSGFTAVMFASSLSSTGDFYYSWSATGVLA